MWKTGILTALVLAAGAAIVRWQAAGRFVEEPRYEVERALGDAIEIRRYAPRVVAATRVRARSHDEAVYEGFRRLAGYIFGGNAGRAELAMTAPVTQGSATATVRGASEGERIAMTAPVTQAPAAEDGSWEVTFTMPGDRTLETLPAPNDARVSLRQIPGERVAVLRYTGLAGPEVVEARTAELRARLAEEGLAPIGDPISARYDPPSTLPFLRRNEIWLLLGDGSADD
jgi:hypothetical protein